MKKLFTSFKTPAIIDIVLDESISLGKDTHTSTRSKPILKTITVADPNDQFGDGTPQTFLRFDKDDPIGGKVIIKPEKAFEHAGIKIELIGEIVTYFETRTSTQFISLNKELAPVGSVGEKDIEYEFVFKSVEKEHESYRGINTDLRYFLRVTIIRNLFSVVKEQEFWIQNSQSEPEGEDPGISMEVGLQGTVLLSIKYDNVFHEIKKGCILGELKFFLVKVKIDKAEVSFIKKETSGVGENAVTDQEVLRKFEIIDGTPAKDETVPIRIYLSAIDAWKLTPTCTNVHNKFSVKYFIHLALCDTKGRRLFKQREITLWRRAL
ncbi:vacuolar protein-sorting protein VPS26 [Acrasis kona]|uniref:Vacuolar protein-sorting protein VPS26 n=1 Tax=Acrasis kona TaxID=1008807 RepID=A0AAW2YJV1_9EUKA